MPSPLRTQSEAEKPRALRISPPTKTSSSDVDTVAAKAMRCFAWRAGLASEFTVTVHDTHCKHI